jgi:hypothetical protein
LKEATKNMMSKKENSGSLYTRILKGLKNNSQDV